MESLEESTLPWMTLHHQTPGLKHHCPAPQPLYHVCKGLIQLSWFPHVSFEFKILMKPFSPFFDIKSIFWCQNKHFLLLKQDKVDSVSRLKYERIQNKVECRSRHQAAGFSPSLSHPVTHYYHIHTDKVLHLVSRQRSQMESHLLYFSFIPMRTLSVLLSLHNFFRETE